MTEDEWFEVGNKRLDEWAEVIRKSLPGYEISISVPEASAFEYAWELAGREMGIVK